MVADGAIIHLKPVPKFIWRVGVGRKASAGEGEVAGSLWKSLDRGRLVSGSSFCLLAWLCGLRQVSFPVGFYFFWKLSDDWFLVARMKSVYSVSGSPDT